MTENFCPARPTLLRHALRVGPGILLCAAIAVAALGLQATEIAFVHRAWLDAIVLAILLGTALRTVWCPGSRWAPGIAFSAKFLLELAVVLLGATVSAAALAAAGPALITGIVAVVGFGLLSSYAIGRLFRLPHRMAILIACGNSICGNSAIAAVAPVIDAKADDVAAAIAFTAVLGVLTVLALPLLALGLQMPARSFGVLAGLTVYAVPQVLAATLPVSALSAQVGTLVKLVRVLMLGPVVLGLALVSQRRRADRVDPNPAGATPRRLPPLRHLAPWFIQGFLLMAAARSAGLLPEAVLGPTAAAATWLTILSMAALGLGVDVRAVARAGLRVTSVVTLSLILLGLIAFALIHGLGL